MTAVEARVQEIRKEAIERISILTQQPTHYLLRWAESGARVCSDTTELIAFAELLVAAERDRDAAKELLRQMVADEAFADLCAGIGEEPKWIEGARALLAAQEVK